MIRRRNTVREALNVQLPEETKTYKPISNEEIIHKITGYSIDKGYSVSDVAVQLSANSQVMFGNITINTENSDYGMNIGFVNSYNKMRSFGVAVGAKVYMCSNLDFSSVRSVQKHTGEIQEDIDTMIYNAVESVQKEYDKILLEYSSMKEVVHTEKQVGELLGRMFYEKGILRSEQLNTFKNVMKTENDWNNYDRETMYGVHMGLTHALKSEQPQGRINKLVESRKLVLEYV